MTEVGLFLRVQYAPFVLKSYYTNITGILLFVKVFLKVFIIVV